MRTFISATPEDGACRLCDEYATKTVILSVGVDGVSERVEIRINLCERCSEGPIPMDVEKTVEDMPPRIIL